MKEVNIVAIKINKLEIENVKRVKAVEIEPSANGLTIVGGNNNQGKTSVLDAIAWALGGNKYKPSQPTRNGSATPPKLHVVLNNGLIVERSGTKSNLKVIDPNGEKGGQQLLNSFVEELAINLAKFMNSSNKDKAQTLLQIIGVQDDLASLELKEKELYNHRREIGQIADQKKKYAEEQNYYPNVPKELVSASELIKQQQAILAKNGENQRKRQQFQQLKVQFEHETQHINDLKAKLKELEQTHSQTEADLTVAQKTQAELKDQSTAELEQSIANIDEINRKVRANLDKDKAEEDAKDYADQYAQLSVDLDKVRQQKTDLLNQVELPLPGLTVVDGELVYQGQKWDNMSGSDQLKVSTAIVRKLKPECGFVLLDKLEQMDLDTLQEFGDWLKREGLQAIATRVSTGDECSIIIEDGYSVTKKAETVGWQGKGAF